MILPFGGLKSDIEVGTPVFSSSDTHRGLPRPAYVVNSRHEAVTAQLELDVCDALPNDARIWRTMYGIVGIADSLLTSCKYYKSASALYGIGRRLCSPRKGSLRFVMAFTTFYLDSTVGPLTRTHRHVDSNGHNGTWKIDNRGMSFTRAWASHPMT